MESKMRDILQVGTTVQLKSGGPVLTIIKAEGEYFACAFWNANLNKFEEVYFDPEVLRIYR